MRKWRVGTVSMALLLIAFGVSLLLAQVLNLFTFEQVIKWWPVVLIVLGIEILVFVYSSGKEEPKIKFDFGSILLIFIILLLSSSLYVFVNITDKFDTKEIMEIFESKDNEKVFISAETIEKKELKNVYVDNANGSVTITGTDSNEIKVKFNISVNNNNKEIVAGIDDKFYEIKNSGETLEIKSLADEIKSKYNEKCEIYDILMSVEIELPKTMNINVENNNGLIDVSSINGKVDLLNQNGNVNARYLDSDLSLNCENSEISLKHISGKTRVDNKGGKVEILNSSNEVQVSNSDGDIDFLNSKITGNIMFFTTNGTIKFELGSNKNYNLLANSINGVIGGTYQSESDNVETQGKLNKVVGEGKPEVKLSTTNGSIELY